MSTIGGFNVDSSGSTDQTGFNVPVIQAIDKVNQSFQSNTMVNGKKLSIGDVIRATGYLKIKLTDNSGQQYNGITEQCTRDGFDIFLSPHNASNNTEQNPYSAMLHEFGHALDDALGKCVPKLAGTEEEASDSNDFRNRRNQDINNPNLADKFKIYKQGSTVFSGGETPEGELASDLIAAMLDPNADLPSDHYPGGATKGSELIAAMPKAAEFLKNLLEGAAQALANNAHKFDDARFWARHRPFGNWLPDFLKPQNNRKLSAINTKAADPLLIDLDGDGIETLSVDSSDVFVPNGSTGFMKKTAWVGLDDGILAVDVNGNGFIDSEAELLGNSFVLSSGSLANNGFAALSQFDSNGSGTVDSADSAATSLRVLRGDGTILTLQEAGIASLSLQKTNNVLVDASGNTQLATGNATLTSGSTIGLADYLFQQNLFDSYTPDSIELAPDVQALPEIAEIGIQRSLRESIQLDTTGRLRTAVEAMLNSTDFNAQSSLWNNVILTWTGGIDQPHSLPFLHMDGQILFAVEKFYGEHLQYGLPGGVPGYYQGEILSNIYTRIRENAYGQFMFSSVFADLEVLLADSSLQQSSDSVIYDPAVAAQYLLDKYNADHSLGELRIKQFVKSYQGLELQTFLDFDSFKALLVQDHPELLAVINSSLNNISTADYDLIDRTAVIGDETITTYGTDAHILLGVGNYTVNASGQNTWVAVPEGSDFIDPTLPRNYTLNLGSGQNQVYLGRGDTSISAGPGNTRIVGGRYNNTYNFDKGDGTWTIAPTEVGSGPQFSDIVNFGAGITADLLNLSSLGNELTITFSDTADLLTFERELGALPKHISVFNFADGTSLTLKELGDLRGLHFVANQSGTTYDRSFSPISEIIELSGSFNTFRGGTGNNHLDVTGGNNTVFLANGNNAITVTSSFNQFFLGSAVAGVTGIGDNTVLDTGVGNQFWFNPGSTQTGSANITVGTNAGINLGTGHVDVNVGQGTGTTVIRRTGPSFTPGDSDTINFGAGITQSSLYFWSPPVASGAVTQYDLNIDIASGEKIVLNAGLAGGAQRVENFTFADGSSLTLDQVLAQGVHVIAFTDPFFGGPSINRNFATWREIVTVIGDNGQLYEGSGNDAIEDRGNNNYINAGAGDNTIIAGNNSTIVSNFGTNTITIKAGSGTTLIQENGALGGAFNNGNDTLIFGAGITEDNILASFTSENTLQINLSTGEQVIIEGETLDPFGIRQVSTFTFAGGQSFTVQQLLDLSVMAINNSLDNVTIDRTTSTANERINNSGHFDTILFGAGTTTLNDTGSDNLVYVGTGKANINASSNSTIFGGAGDATITLAGGVSGVQVFEQTAGTGTNGFDSVVLSGAVSVDEFTLSSVGKDLTLTDSLGTSVLTLKDGLDATAVAKSVADFAFSNGSHIAFTDLIQRGVNVSDSSSDATVDRSFSAAKEIITHTGSNGTFLLGSGDVTMTVGTNDIIHSGSGSSLFNIAEGSGSTTIIEDALSVNSGAGDSIQLLNPVDTNQVTVRASGADFTLGFAPGDTITLVNQLDGVGLKNIGAFINSDGSILVDSVEIQQIADASRSTAGDDVLTGSRFGDQINGGDGNDTVAAGIGNDDLSGGLGDDILSGDAGNDFLYGDDGDDTLNGGSGEDILNGYVGADTLNGNDGNDVLVGGLGNDIASGGIGDDTYVFNLGDGVDTIDDGAGALGGGNDAIELGALRPNVLFAAEGEDLRISFTQSAESVLVQGFLSADSSRHIELVKFSDGSNISYADIVTLVSAPPGQDIYGTNGNDTLAGTIGADRIYGQNGHDTINAGPGDDLAYGGNGNDALNGEDGNDTLFGEAGVDTLHGGIGMDALDGGAGNDFIYGDEGDDNLLGGTGLDELHGGDGNDSLDGGAADDTLYGNNGNDVLAGGAGIDYLHGGTGTDSLDGGSGADFLYGEDDNDTLAGGGGNDTLDGGAGDDNLDGGSGADFLYGMDGNDVLSGGTGIDTIDGGIGDDTISGGNGNDVLLGGDGIDHIDGGVGSDDIHGGAGDDILIGAGGNDTIAGDDGNDSIYGDTGNDILTGGTGNDYLEGKNGVDTLTGSTGDDSLVGGYGNDTYLFSQGDGVDTINDQGRVSDHMDTIRFGTGITTQDVAFYMQGNDLYLSQGAGDSIKITDQASTTSKIEKFELADGHFAGSADLNLIIQQMTAYQQQHTEVNISSVNDVRNNQDLMTIVSNVWHAA